MIDDPVWELEQGACSLFAQMFARYTKLTEELQASVRDMVQIINSKEVDAETRKAALYNLTDALYPDETVIEEIEVEKIKEEAEVPCEWCSKTPTHLIKFHQPNRKESHYLCKSCEKKIDEFI